MEVQYTHTIGSATGRHPVCKRLHTSNPQNFLFGRPCEGSSI